MRACPRHKIEFDRNGGGKAAKVIRASKLLLELQQRTVDRGSVTHMPGRFLASMSRRKPAAAAAATLTSPTAKLSRSALSEIVSMLERNDEGRGPGIE